MRWIQCALLTMALLFTTGTVQVGERADSVEQVQTPSFVSHMPARGPSSCCMGPIRGNVDYDQYDLVDIMDLVHLIDWMFRGGPEPPCLREANVDGSCCADSPGESSADISISDLVYLVEYLFIGGPPPARSPTPERWEKTYGGVSSDIGVAVEQTDDGGYIIGGTVWSENADVYLIKTDAWGDTIWSRTIGSPLYEEAYDVAVTPDGGYIITGISGIYHGVSNDIYIVKISTAGYLVWERSYGGPGFDCGYSVVALSSGGYLVAGSVQDSAQHYRACLLRLNESGDSLWSRTYGTGGLSTVARSLAITPDGGCLMTGWHEPNLVLLLKIDSLGYSMWSRTYDVGYVGISVLPTTDGGCILTGMSDLIWGGSFVLKADSLGQTLWSRELGESGEDGSGRTVLQVADGNYVITGMESRSPDWDFDVYLAKLDSEGNTVWFRTYGGSGQDYGLSAAKTADSGFIITGMRDMFTDGVEHWDVYLIKTDSLGYSQ